jgi:hypothetical protein
MTRDAERWGGDVFRQHPVIASHVLRLARYARRLLPPRIRDGGADAQA